MSKGRALEVLPRSPSRLGALVRMLVPSATAFFTGACLLILILVASRLAARSVGASLYTWTALLGVVLAGISLGNYLGGRIADRYHARRALAVLFGLSSAACVGMVVANNVAGEWLGLWRLSWPGHVVIHVLLVLFLPTTLLGAVSPVVAKLALDQGLAVGRTIGSIYAWAAVGGIVGTFLTGFFLIPAFGNVAVVWLVGTALLVMAVLYWISCWVMYLWGMVFIALLTMGMANEKWAQDARPAALLRERPDPNLVYQAETPYGRVAVRQIARRPDTRAFVQSGLPRSEMVVSDATHLSDFYLKVYAGLTHGLGENKKNLSLLVMGAGGYAWPRYVKTAWPDCRLEVVEIDPGVTQAATVAFGLDRGATIETVATEARNYVNRLAEGGRTANAAGRYDFIYENTLDDCATPFQRVTKEFNDEIAGLLAEDGVYMIHLLDVGPGGRLLGAVVNTVRETFPHVYVIAGRAGSPVLGEAFVVVAAKRKIEPQAILEERSRHLPFTVLDDAQLTKLKQSCGGVILTDDHAPVDYLLTPLVKHSAMEALARKYFDKAKEFQGSRQYELSIQWYHQALEVDPSRATVAYEQIGLMCLAWNKPEKAIDAFRQALRAQDRAEGRYVAIGSVHMNLGLLLGRRDKVKEAREQLTLAVAAFHREVQESPNAVVAWEQLGETSAALGDFKGASDAFDRAVTLEPRYPSHYEKLARALEFQRRYEEAVAVVRKQVELMKEQGRRDLVAQLNHYIDVLEYKRVKQAK